MPHSFIQIHFWASNLTSFAVNLARMFMLWFFLLFFCQHSYCFASVITFHIFVLIWKILATVFFSSMCLVILPVWRFSASCGHNLSGRWVLYSECVCQFLEVKVMIIKCFYNSFSVFLRNASVSNLCCYDCKKMSIAMAHVCLWWHVWKKEGVTKQQTRIIGSKYDTFTA